MFRVLERDETLASRVTGEIERLIHSSQLSPGDRLPAERELAAQFGVSRTVVREAVRSLVAKGLLDVTPGSGTVVSKPTMESLTQTMTLFLRDGKQEIDHVKVIEVRRLLEVEIAGLAAGRRTPEDLQAMEAILTDQRGIREKRDRFVEWDLSFHSALAAATQNQLFPLLLDSVVATMKQVRELGFDIPTTPEQAIKFHAAILEQVKKGSITGARKAMNEHLIEAERTMLRAMSIRAARKRRSK